MPIKRAQIQSKQIKKVAKKVAAVAKKVAAVAKKVAAVAKSETVLRNVSQKVKRVGNVLSCVSQTCRESG